MKKFFVCLFAAVALFTTGCSKDDDPKAEGIAVATVEGKEYKFTEYVWQASTLNDGSYNLYSNVDEDTPTYDLSIDLGAKKTGKIALDGKNKISIKIDKTTYYGVSGEINVTTFDSKNVNGTFTGKFSKGVNSAGTVDIVGSFTSFENKL